MKKNKWVLSSLAIAFMRQQRFIEALNELAAQTLDNFVHILVSSVSILDQLNEGICLTIFNRKGRITRMGLPRLEKN